MRIIFPQNKKRSLSYSSIYLFVYMYVIFPSTILLSLNAGMNRPVGCPVWEDSGKLGLLCSVFLILYDSEIMNTKKTSYLSITGSWGMGPKQSANHIYAYTSAPVFLLNCWCWWKKGNFLSLQKVTNTDSIEKKNVFWNEIQTQEAVGTSDHLCKTCKSLLTRFFVSDVL